MPDEYRLSVRVIDPALVESITVYLESTKQTTSVLVRDAVEAYLSNNKALPSPSDENCLVELAKRFMSWGVDRMAKACEGKHQPTELAALLLDYCGGDEQISESLRSVAEKRGTYRPTPPER